MSTSNKGRHRARGRAAQSRTRAGAVAAAMTSLAVAGGAALPAAPASAAPFVLAQKCAGGSGATLSNVNCQNSSASQLGSAIGAALPADVAAILKFLQIDLNSSAVVLASNGTATISGAGFSLAAQALNPPLFGGAGGTSTSNAITPLSAAVAVGTGKGIASSTAASGIAVAASGSGTASAVSVAGVATAINILGIKNVTCTALYGRASADGVGSCTSVLYLFTAKNAAGSDVWTFAVADPTSFTLGGDGALPVAHFARDLIRVSVGGSGGPTVGTDLFAVPTVSKSAVALSSRAATGRSESVVTRSAARVHEAAASPVVEQPTDNDEQRTPGSDEPLTSSQSQTPPSASDSSTGKRRKPEADSTTGFAESSVPARSMSVPAQPTGVGTQSTGVATQSTGVATQSTSLGAQSTGTD